MKNKNAINCNSNQILKGFKQIPKGWKSTDIGLIPEDWEVLSLGDVVDFKTGKLNSNAANPEGVYPFFTCSQGDFWINKFAFDQEAVLLSGNNARAVYSVKYYKGKFNAYQRTYVITIKDKSTYHYLFLKFALEFNLDRLKLISIGTSTKYLTLGLLVNLPFIKPDYEEQKKIAHILSKIQQAIETQEQIIKTTQELKKALMQKLFTEGLNGEPQKQSAAGGEIGLIPESWEVKTLEKLTVETYTRNPSKEHPNKFIKYVDVSSISNEFFKIINHQFVKGLEAPGRARKVIKTNDIIFATIRPTLKRIAKVNSDYNDEYCSTAFCVLRTNGKLINEDYLYYYLQTDFFIDEIAKLQSGASYPAVRDDNVKSMMIPLPKIPEQKQIADLFLFLDRKLNLAFEKKAVAADLFSTTLGKLMTGQIRVKDIEFELEGIEKTAEAVKVS